MLNNQFKKLGPGEQENLAYESECEYKTKSDY